LNSAIVVQNRPLQAVATFQIRLDAKPQLGYLKAKSNLLVWFATKAYFAIRPTLTG
jgi:hypothetical protein